MSSAGCTGRTQSAVAGICKPYAVERRFVVECCRARQTVRGVGVGWHVGGHIGGIVDGQGVYGPPPWGLPAADRFEEACRSMAKSVAKSAWVRSRAGAQAAGSWCDSQPCWTRRCSRYGARANIRAGARACSSRMTVTIGACILLSRCGVKSEAVSRSPAEGTTAAAWSTGSTMATSLEWSESPALSEDSEVSETRSMGAWESSAGTSSAGASSGESIAGPAPPPISSGSGESVGSARGGPPVGSPSAGASPAGGLTRPEEGGRPHRVKKASLGSSSTTKPSCSSGAVPALGSLSRSTRCVLRRNRRQRPSFTGSSQAIGRQVWALV